MTTGALAVRMLPFGERAVLAELAGLDEVLELYDRLWGSAAGSAAPGLPTATDPTGIPIGSPTAIAPAGLPTGVIDLVPAARTILVHVDPLRLPVAAARAWVERVAAHGGMREAGRGAAPGDAAPVGSRPAVRLPVVYDGEDLDDTARLLGVSAAALVAAHTSARWRVAFTGFAPGFGYLVSDDWPFDVPRLDAPRPRVPAGAVGLAGGFSGAYPRETPGGWRLIASTATTLFHPDATPPALLAPGAAVRFEAVRAELRTAPAGRGDPSPAGQGHTAPRAQVDTAPDAEAPGLTIVAPGARATVQDLGRPGHAAAGVPRAGAADPAALRLGNRLVGTAEHAAAVELTLGGFRARAERDVWFVVTGAWGPITLDGVVVDPCTATRWPAGAELFVGAFTHGARGYLCVRGGIDGVDGGPRGRGGPVLGSRSTDSLSGLGPAPLAAGDALAVGAAVVSAVPVDDLHPWHPPPEAVEVRVAPGPRADWFTGAARELLFDTVWTVSTQADRVGIRLDGPSLSRSVPGELTSEGMLPGAIQVPPDGRPVVFGPDAPVTGGYPVIGVVVAESQAMLAQARPGTRVRLRRAAAVR